MRQKKAKKILEKTKRTYENIAEEFDITRTNKCNEFDLFMPYVKRGSKIADIGCGNGRLLGFMQKHFSHDAMPEIEYIGIDNSTRLLARAKKQFPNGNFIEGDMLDLPLDNGILDIIFCVRAFHHIPSRKERVAALLQMRRTLKNNGILIITVWNLWQKKYYRYILRAFLRFIYSFGGYAVNDTFIPWGKKAKRYYHAFTPLELTKIVNSSGFEIEELFCIKEGKRVPFKQSHDIVVIAKKIISDDAD